MKHRKEELKIKKKKQQLEIDTIFLLEYSNPSFHSGKAPSKAHRPQMPSTLLRCLATDSVAHVFP